MKRDAEISHSGDSLPPFQDDLRWEEPTFLIIKTNYNNPCPLIPEKKKVIIRSARVKWLIYSVMFSQESFVDLDVTACPVRIIMLIVITPRLTRDLGGEKKAFVMIRNN